MCINYCGVFYIIRRANTKIWDLKKIYGAEWKKYSISNYNFSIDSKKTAKRLNGLVENRQRVFLVIAPLSRNNILSSQKIILEKLKDYKPDKVITMGNIRIFSLSRTLK